MMADFEPDELGDAPARIEDSRMRDGSAGGTHALATGVKPRGNGLYGRGSNELVDGVTTLGLRVLQPVGYRGK